jgi:hypothetical protein
MKARILFLLGCLVFGGCNEPKVSPSESHNTTPAATPIPSPGPLYLAERVAVATEESLYGLKAGTELKLIEERPTSLLVEAEGMRFEIDPRQTTRDRELARTLLARTTETNTLPQVTTVERWQIEDRRFLAEENLRRLAAEEAHLRNAVDQPKAQ